jgi:hypothetical protein
MTTPRTALNAADLKAEPEGPSVEQIEAAAKLIYASMRFAVAEEGRGVCDWVERGNSLMQDEARRTARAILAGRDCPATPPSPEAPGEALAARPLLEKVARLDSSAGTTVAEVRQLAGQAAAWLGENPPGQPVAIEPRGCPTPGACSCVEPTPPAPQAGEVALAGNWRSAESLQLAHESCRLFGTNNGDCPDSEICWLDMLPCFHYENRAIPLPAPQAGEVEA